MVEDVFEHQSVWEEKEYLAEEYEAADEKADADLQLIIKSEAQGLPDEDNPIELLRTWKSGAFLNLIRPNEFTLSEKTLDSCELLSERNLRKGYGTL